MKDIPHDWLFPESLKIATGVQRELAERVIAEDDFGAIETIGGTDISCGWRNSKAPVHAAIVTMDWPSLEPREMAGASMLPRFPYVSGYLGFRESPSLVEAFGRLGRPPDLLFVDGQGLSHPRGCGIASQLGVLLDTPSIGVAKSILIGEPAASLGPDAGDHVPMIWKDRIVGMAVRTKPRCKPLYVSVGHRISLDSAVDHVLRATRGYRHPEPTRRAHIAANDLRRRADA
ncbi:MAG: endonuclease V [Sphingomonadaceae bacterium]|nr:endonuclease V [Sphingomonadaceae bacterium]